MALGAAMGAVLSVAGLAGCFAIGWSFLNLSLYQNIIERDIKVQVSKHHAWHECQAAAMQFRPWP